MRVHSNDLCGVRPRHATCNCHVVTFRALRHPPDIAHLLRMNSIAPIQNSDKPMPARKISKRVRHAVDLLVTGRARTQVDAATQAGLSRERLCRALREDHVQGYLEQAVKRTLATSRAPAAATLLRLLTEAKSEHVQKDAATTLLGINGIGITDRGPVVNVGVSVGYVIDLRGAGDTTPLIDVTPGADDRPSSVNPATPRGYSR